MTICEVALSSDSRINVQGSFNCHSTAQDCTTTCKSYSVYGDFESGFTCVLFNINVCVQVFVSSPGMSR